MRQYMYTCTCTLVITITKFFARIKILRKEKIGLFLFFLHFFIIENQIAKNNLSCKFLNWKIYQLKKSQLQVILILCDQKTFLITNKLKVKEIINSVLTKKMFLQYCYYSSNTVTNTTVQILLLILQFKYYY